VDLRGFGESSTPEQAYTIEGYSDDLAFLTERLGAKRLVVIGHSVGGLMPWTLPHVIPSGSPERSFSKHSSRRRSEHTLDCATCSRDCARKAFSLERCRCDDRNGLWMVQSKAVGSPFPRDLRHRQNEELVDLSRRQVHSAINL
jgi:hypothetical protein